jgi:putative cell wall-binding protein
MVRFRSLVTAAALVALVASGLTLGTPQAASAAPRDDVVSLTNAHRANAGLSALARESKLDAMAQEWANRMSSIKKMEHSTNEWRTSRATAGWTLCCGENIAYGYTSASAVVSGWINSPGHRANILDSRYTHIGVGHATDGNYWVQVFATYPQSPQVSGPTPTISGTTTVGSTVTASAGSWSPGGIYLKYQWRLDGTPISGATARTYTITPMDADRRLSVSVTGSLSGYRSATKTSAGTAAVKTDLSVERVAGASRIDVAVNISKRSYPYTAPVVYIATAWNFPDAVGAAPAAARQGGPLLLVDVNSASSSVLGEVRRLAPKKIVIVGGTASVSAGVASTLSSIAPVQRVSGASRYSVSLDLAEQAFGGSGATTAYIATGAKYPDAVSAGSAAGSQSAPLLLVPPTDRPSADLLDTLRGLGVTTVKIAGGTASVSSAFERSIAASGFSTQRLGGSNRYAANQAINADAYASSGTALLATGSNFPDALTGSAWAAKLDAPLFTTTGGCVQRGTVDLMKKMGVKKVILLGGTPSLSVDVAEMRPC